MAKTSFEAEIEQDPTNKITRKLDEALGYDYEQLRQDAVKLAQLTSRLIERASKIEGSDADARVGSLMVTEARLVEIDFHLRNGDHLAHLEDAAS